MSGRRVTYRFVVGRLVLLDSGSDREMLFDAGAIPKEGLYSFGEAVAQAYEAGFSRGVASAEAPKTDE
jgi:hypothetical protein